jgi:hypothetical protein
MKKFLFIFLSIIINHCALAQGLSTNGQITTNGSVYVSSNGAIKASTGVDKNGQIVTTPLSVGSSYQGGIIFYFFVAGDPGYVAGETHGLIVATSDLSGNLNKTWGCYGTNTPGTLAGIGYGKQNNAVILAACPTSSSGTTTSGPYLCSILTLGGYSDWYVPSQNEYSTLYSVSSSIGISLNSRHWTSTQDNRSGWETNGIFMQAVGTTWGTTDKGNTYNVRPIRTF